MERDCTELPQSQLMQGLPGHGGDWTFTLSEGKSNCRSLRQRAVWSDLVLKSTTKKTRTQVFDHLEAKQLRFAFTSNYLWLPGLILAHLSFLPVAHATLYYLHVMVCTCTRLSVCEILKPCRQEYCDLGDR